MSKPIQPNSHVRALRPDGSTVAVPAHLVKKKAFRIQKLVVLPDNDPRIVHVPDTADAVEVSEAPAKRGPGRPPKSETNND